MTLEPLLGKEAEGSVPQGHEALTVPQRSQESGKSHDLLFEVHFALDFEPVHARRDAKARPPRGAVTEVLRFHPPAFGEECANRAREVSLGKLEVGGVPLAPEPRGWPEAECVQARHEFCLRLPVAAQEPSMVRVDETFRRVLRRDTPSLVVEAQMGAQARGNPPSGLQDPDLRPWSGPALFELQGFGHGERDARVLRQEGGHEAHALRGGDLDGVPMSEVPEKAMHAGGREAGNPPLAQKKAGAEHERHRGEVEMGIVPLERAPRQPALSVGSGVHDQAESPGLTRVPCEGNAGVAGLLQEEATRLAQRGEEYARGFGMEPGRVGQRCPVPGPSGPEVAPRAAQQRQDAPVVLARKAVRLCGGQRQRPGPRPGAVLLPRAREQANHGPRCLAPVPLPRRARTPPRRRRGQRAAAARSSPPPRAARGVRWSPPKPRDRRPS